MLLIHPSSRFKRSFKRMPAHISENFKERIELFRTHPFHPALKTHKLGGNLERYWAFYLRDGYRVLFDFEDTHTVLLVNIGSHDDYRKWGKM